MEVWKMKKNDIGSISVSIVLQQKKKLQKAVDLIDQLIEVEFKLKEIGFDIDIKIKDKTS